MNEKWFLLPIEQIEKKLKTNAASGLSRKAARSRIDRNSGSVFYIPKKAPLRIFTDILSDFALIILLLTAVVALFFEEYRSVLAVLVLLIGNLLAAWFLCYRSEKTMTSLVSFFYPMTRVIRKGRLFCVDFRTVVPGDVILIEKGDILCCDARLVTSEHLKVTMKLDRDRELSLDKLADGSVLPKTYSAQDMVNMVHAGSVVEQGSGRAIVTAVGKYTYLGAMTGGIPLSSAEATPDLFKRFRKHCSKINMLLLLAVLPFSLLSLLFSHIGGGSVLLSASFLTGLSLVATSMSQLGCTLSKLFFVHQCRRMLYVSHSAVIRNAEVFERVGDADYIFLLDGAALTDGILHFSSAICAEGELRNFQNLSKSGILFAELVSLYHTASGRMLTTGISGAGDYAAGLGEFIKKSGVDEGALRIRCSISSYTTGDLLQACEQVTFCDRDIPNVLQVSRSYELIDRCDTVLIGGQAQSLSAEGKATLKKQWHRAIESHSVPLIFAISFGSSEVQALCFAGMLMLKEGIDPHAKQNAAYLEKAGCKVISFSGATEAPSMPLYALEQIAISKQEFVKRKLPLIYRLGQISCYADFSEEDICLLIDEIHRRKQKVFVVGFTQSACAIAKRADGLIACSSIQPRTKRYWDTELSVSELEGQHYSMSCSQMVKQQADCLIPRPSNGRGGLSSLVTLVGRIKEAYRNFSDYVRYLISVSIMRILVVSIPMLFGKTILDARHVLFFGCLMDSVALLMFVCRKKSIPSNSKNYISVRRVSEYFFGDAPMLLAGIAAGVSVFLAPELLGLLSFAGLYHDKTEYSFVALIFLHILSFFLIYAGPHIKNSVKNKILWGEIALLLVFLILCFVWKPFGGFFGIESLPPFPYLLLTLFPSLVYGCVMLLLSRRRKR